ncbi:Bacteroides conjugative transposon TraM protein [Chitinophaga jiangningensis]|uniref:Bacteroides conjugative transposon TraM protein n=1 Tax=Chitinophaga jiangningensis TaxID=1419482 RepID=A0A1M6XWF8_9BACT|nr:conjugative transposon protein TraM [Chitinophaga jiangningensis]SHL10334.1 Bacteroides conjugative transposon TraM protein [Chitinophaga jiangningensis]
MKNDESAVNEKLRKQRQFLMVMPVLVIPFLTILLSSFGVIGGKGKGIVTVVKKDGINTDLPGAKASGDSSWNKLMYYEMADKDSAKLRTLKEKDPYYATPSVYENIFSGDTSGIGYVGGDQQKKSLYGISGKDENEEKVYRKIAAINSELERSATKEPAPMPTAEIPRGNVDLQGVDRLEAMMKEMSEDKPDKQMEQISGVLEKILDIQHPGRVKDRLQEMSESNRSQVFSVKPLRGNDVVSLLEADTGRRNTFLDSLRAARLGTSNKFYSLDDEAGDVKQNTVRAVIAESKEVMDGSKVQLRLLEDIYVAGVLVPRNAFVWGKGKLTDGRFVINITSIQYGNNILPVDLSVFDMDGILGVDVNANMATEVTKQTTDQAIQSLSIASLDPSIGAQAASAGIQAAKSLVGRKLKVVKVNIRSGYDVLLVDNNVKNR